jgi:hypothetical protein
VGWVLTHFHRYSILFVVASTMYLIAFLLLKLIVPRLEKIDTTRLLNELP